jgi:outer membrane biosynthesis protein TonB
MTTESRMGWAASLVVHGILLLLFFFISIPEIIQNQDFIEVTWGAPSSTLTSSEPNPAPAEPSSASPSAVVVAKKEPRTVKKPSQPVILPERRMADLSQERLPAQKAEKLETLQQGRPEPRVEEGKLGEREGTSGRSIGERERADPSTVPGSSTGLTPGSGGLGQGVEKGVAFSIQWTQGGTRRKISGDLPKYPAGVNVEAQIKLLAVVLPDGSVRSAQPAQKANTKLEDAAIKDVRFWKFEPLRQSQPQREQSCIVTFLFTLK